jgi:hypothetical protein
MTRRAPRGQAMRRYPALGYLAATGALALLLPSGLTLPNSGPPTLAEYAPVPGQGEGSSDTGELGLPTTGGLGAGGAGGGAGGPSAAPSQSGSVGGGELIRRPGTKRCVGNPPRQTEDPLSPPCIAFFDGDNFGATAKGVTGSEVRVVLQVDFNASTSPQDRDEGKRLVDCAAPLSEGDNTQDHFCKGYMTYFNDRYQTYGRRVRLWANHGFSAAELEERLRPFAYVNESGSMDPPKFKTVSVGYLTSERSRYAAAAPYKIGFRPDNTDAARMAASYVCLKLVGGAANLTDDPRIAGRTRQFAYWHSQALNDYESNVLDQLEKQCGLTIPQERRVAGYNDRTAAARLQAAGVTTVILSSFVGNTAHALVTSQATAATFFPEWVIPGSAGMRDINSNFYGRAADPAQWRSTVGITFDYRRPALTDQTWYRAWREGCPPCPSPTGTGVSGAAHIYDSLTMLFYGIQAAGPRLTPENVDRGLHAIPQQGSANPYKPAAYFAPGNYTFIKDAMAIWWDPSGRPPGSPNQGCYRLPHDGRRFRAGEWVKGDGDIRAAGPCMGDPF